VLLKFRKEIGMLFNKRTSLLIYVLPALIMASEAVNALPLKADYTPSDAISDFDNYDFGGGVLLVKGLALNALSSGAVIEGSFQTYVTSHQLNGVGVSNASLNDTGSGLGYELTMVAEFSAKITNINEFGFGFNLISGNATLYLDKTPDYSFSSDSGFANGDVLLSSSTASGNGMLSSFGFGMVNVDFLSSSVINTNVYGDISITEASTLFALNANSFGQIQGVTSVAGNGVELGDYLFAVDGGLQLSQNSEVVATPLPLSIWLFGSAVVGLASFSRRKEAL